MTLYFKLREFWLKLKVWKIPHIYICTKKTNQCSRIYWFLKRGLKKCFFHISLKLCKIIIDKKGHIMIHFLDFISIKSVTCLSITLSFLAAPIKVRQYLILNNYLNTLSKYICQWVWVSESVKKWWSEWVII